MGVLSLLVRGLCWFGVSVGSGSLLIRAPADPGAVGCGSPLGRAVGRPVEQGAAIRSGRAQRQPVPRKPGIRTDPTTVAAPSAGPEPLVGAQRARCCRDTGAGQERG